MYTFALRSTGRLAWLQSPRGRPPHCRRSAPCPALIGIDLGTTNSAVAAIIDAQPVVLADQATGNRTVPSVVAFTNDDRTVVGWEALAACAGRENTFYSFKRLLGQKLSRVAADAARLLYTVAEGDLGEALVYSPAADGMVTPEELSAELLRHLVRLAEGALAQRVTGAVLTIPAHFNSQQKDATLAAAQLAGLPRALLLQEPVAAALAHGIGGGTDGETVLVFDLGGGTFDVSVLQAFEGIIEVLGTAGDAYLGGDDIDAAVAEWLLQQQQQGQQEQQQQRRRGAGADENDASSDSCGASSNGREDSRPASDAWGWALGAAERAKVALAASPSARIELPGGQGGSVTLTTQQLERLTSGLFCRMAAVLEALGSRAHVEWAMPPSAAAPGGSPAAAAAAAGSCEGSAGGIAQPVGDLPAVASSSSRSSVGSDTPPPPQQQRQQQQQAQQQQGRPRFPQRVPRGGQQQQRQQQSEDRWAPPPRRVSRVVLVGQSTRLPSVQVFVERLTGVKPTLAVDPAEAVALGAAVHAGMLLGEVEGIELMDGGYSAELHGRASGWDP